MFLEEECGGPMPENKTQQELATACRALEMLADGMPYEKVAKYSKLTLEEVKALDTKKPA